VAALTIVIPTYNRGAILVDALGRLLALERRADAVIVVDQTVEHPDAVRERLEAWEREGAIRWLRLAKPSIPHAMNEGLRAAETPLVLFLDDDIEPSARLVEEHIAAHERVDAAAVVGQILQPGQLPETYAAPKTAAAIRDLEFHFNADRGTFIANVMAGNLSVRRERALAIGGFDENFVGAAYRFESDFALRLVANGERIWFEPRATLRHLQLSSGGLRSYGDHRTSTSPMHAVGDYYFALRHAPAFWPYAFRRLVQNVATRWHLRHPWWIPSKLTGEIRGLLLARKLVRER
jgi:GT2 family glycosyltransferase